MTAATDFCTVAQLIEILQAQDPDARVVIANGPGLVNSLVGYQRSTFMSDVGFTPMFILFPNEAYEPVDGYIADGDDNVTEI